MIGQGSTAHEILLAGSTPSEISEYRNQRGSAALRRISTSRQRRVRGSRKGQYHAVFSALLAKGSSETTALLHEYNLNLAKICIR